MGIITKTMIVFCMITFASTENEPYVPGKGSGGSPTSATTLGRNDLVDDIDPETAFQNQQRLAHDDFLRDQDLAEQVAIEAEFQRREKLGSRPASADSGEDSPESDEESKESEKNPVKRWPEAGQSPNDGTGANFHFDPNPVAAVPWDDRPKPNVTRGAGSSGFGILGKFKNLVPIPSIMPKIFRRRQGVHAPPTSSPNKSLIRRMLQFRGKRDTKGRNIATPFLTQLGPGIKSSDQCRILYNGCELNYDQVMQIAEEGQVLIEGDDPTTTSKPNRFQIHRLKLRPEDDEAEQAAKLYNSQKKKKTSGYKIKNKNHQSPGAATNTATDDNSDEEEGPVRRKVVPSLPIRPMKFNWGRPLVYVNGRPQSPEIFGVRKPTAPPTPPPQPTTPPPVFVTKPLYTKINRTITETNVVHINATHALEIKTPKSKPYRPDRAALSDKNGNPASFASVFTEIAGSSGGIHDYFDKIAQSVGGAPQKRSRTTKEIPPPPPARSEEDEENSDEEEEDDIEQDDVVPDKPETDQEEPESEEEEEDVKDQDDDKENDDEEPPQDDEKDSIEAIKTKPKATPFPKEKYSTEGKIKNKTKKKSKKTKKKVVPKPVDDEAEDDLDLEADPADDPADDVADDIADEETTPSPKKKKKKSKQKPKKVKGKVKDKEEEEEYDSEEVRKRNKAADEVELPEFLSDDVKHAIREGIRNGHKEDHGKPKEPEKGSSDDPDESQDDDGGGGGQGQVEGEGQAGPGYYGHYGDPHSRPQQRPKRPGLFSFFG